MVYVGIVSRRSNTWKTLNMLFCLPKRVVACNVCLGFGFLCLFSVLFGSLSGLVGVFVWLGVFFLFFVFSLLLALFFPFSLASTASLEPTV